MVRVEMVVVAVTEEEEAEDLVAEVSGMEDSVVEDTAAEDSVVEETLVVEALVAEVAGMEEEEAAAVGVETTTLDLVEGSRGALVEVMEVPPAEAIIVVAEAEVEVAATEAMELRLKSTCTSFRLFRRAKNTPEVISNLRQFQPMELRWPNCPARRPLINILLMGLMSQIP